MKKKYEEFATRLGRPQDKKRKTSPYLSNDIVDLLIHSKPGVWGREHFPFVNFLVQNVSERAFSFSGVLACLLKYFHITPVPSPPSPWPKIIPFH
jgi:hypothetical protein